MRGCIGDHLLGAGPQLPLRIDIVRSFGLAEVVDLIGVSYYVDAVVGIVAPTAGRSV
jgi:hypothetical protein